MIPQDTPFWKLEGAGNDFVLFEAQRLGNWFDDPGLRRRICDRHFGIGADGILVWRPSQEADIDFLMDYYNRDGLPGTFCGNGARCLALYHFMTYGKEKARFRAADGIHSARRTAPDSIELSMGDIRHVENIGEHVYFLDSGSPHYVHISTVSPPSDFVEWANPIRHNFRPDGTNVNWIYPVHGQWHLRTFERGVEAETLSCGTGAVAAAIALYLHSPSISSPPITLKSRGGTLIVNFIPTNTGFCNITLEGPARVVFEGRIANISD